MSSEVKLSPGWLLRDVRKAAARLDPSQRGSGSNAISDRRNSEVENAATKRSDRKIQRVG